MKPNKSIRSFTMYLYMLISFGIMLMLIISNTRRLTKNNYTGYSEFSKFLESLDFSSLLERNHLIQTLLLSCIEYFILKKLNPKQFEKCEKLISIAEKTEETYKGETAIPLKKNKVGVRYGLFSSFYQDSAESVNDFNKKLSSSFFPFSAINFVIQQVRDTPSLWTNGNPYTYMNYFLRALRVRDIELYKHVVGTACNVKFLSNGSHTLFRRDTRKSTTIFEEGFKLQSGLIIDPNAAAVLALDFVGATHEEAWTLDHGISTSTVIPPTWYGRVNRYYQNYSKTTKKPDRPDRYFVIRLPENHNLLLVDVTNSPCNQQNLKKHPHRFALKEVNSVDSIPRQYIYSRNKEVSFFASPRPGKENGQNEKINPNYDKTYRQNPRRLPVRGAY